PSDPLTFQLTYYHINDIRVKNVFDELQRNTSDAVRGDREMSTCEMISVIDEARNEQAQAIRDRSSFLIGDLRTLLALPPIPPQPPVPAGQREPSYCRWIESVQGLVLPKTAEAQTPAQAPRPQAPRPHVPRPRAPGVHPPRPPG